MQVNWLGNQLNPEILGRGFPRIPRIHSSRKRFVCIFCRCVSTDLTSFCGPRVKRLKITLYWTPKVQAGMAQSKAKFDLRKIKESMIWSKLTSNKPRYIPLEAHPEDLLNVSQDFKGLYGNEQRSTPNIFGVTPIKCSLPNKERSIVTGIVLVIVLVVSLVLAFAIPKKSPEKEGKFLPRVSVLRQFMEKSKFIRSVLLLSHE